MKSIECMRLLTTSRLEIDRAHTTLILSKPMLENTCDLFMFELFEDVTVAHQLLCNNYYARPRRP
jgi:hypothetical protein